MAFVTLDRHRQRQLAGFGVGVPKSLLWSSGRSPTEEAVQKAASAGAVGAGSSPWISSAVVAQTIKKEAAEKSGFSFSNEQLVALGGGALVGLTLVYLLA